MLAAALAILPGCAGAQDGELIRSLERLAEANNPEAIYHLGMAYQTGTGVAEDHAKALGAFRKAAALGDALASYKLGCYYDGQDGLITPDTKLALQYKMVAAKAGYALAEQDVGALYLQSGDAPTAVTWLEKSAAQGWSGALMALAAVYNGAANINRDPAKTAAYFRLFLARSEPSAKQVEWLRQFEEQLSAGDRKRADEIVDGYHPAPTPLTLKGLAGQRAAQSLVGQSAPDDASRPTLRTFNR